MSSSQVGTEKKLMADSPDEDFRTPAGSAQKRPDSGQSANKIVPLQSDITEKSPEQFVDVLGSDKSPLRTMFSYSNRRCCQISGGFVMLLLGSVANFAVPGLLGMVVDAITKKDWSRIDQLVLFMLIIVFVSGIASGIRGSLFNITSFGIARDIRYDLFYALIRKDIGYFDETKTGELLSRMSSDTEVVQAGLSVNFSMLFRAVIFIIVSIVILALISWKLTLVTVGGIIPFGLFAICMSLQMRELSKKLQDKKSELAQASEEAISNIRTVKAFASEKQEIKKFEEINKEVYELGLSLALVGACFAFLTGLVFNGMFSVIVYYGSRLSRDGEITIGQITSFLLYMIQLVFNFAIISFTFSNLFKMSGASEKIVEIMQQVPAVNYSGGVTIPADQVVGEIELKNVVFEYPTKKDVKICKNVSLKVKKNQVVALVGPSGCGKSSIISLIERFYDPIEGQVLFSGVDVKDLDARWYKRQIAIVSQEPVLFSGSIRENICYGLELDEVSEEQLRDACRKANALNFIMDKSVFPDGFDTLVGERGIKLSGGQKQRVAIARALIRKPKLLLLDEATSALDAESEHLVQQALDELIKLGLQTVICIAHRLSTIRDADVIMVMKSGEIVERGSHNELMQIDDGVYKALISRQLQSRNNGMSASPMREAEQDVKQVAAE